MKKLINPIYYKDIEEMDKKLVSELIEELRTDITRVRGKIQDINRAYGFDDKLDFIEGGLSCMLVSMYHSMEMFQKFEEKWGKEKLKDN